MRPVNRGGLVPGVRPSAVPPHAPGISDPVTRLEKRRLILADLKKQLEQPAWLAVSSEAQNQVLRDLVRRLERVVAAGEAALQQTRMPQPDPLPTPASSGAPRKRA